jgi:putative ABC transport system permease protein
VLAALSIAGFVAGAVVLAVAVLVWIPLTRRRIAAVGGALIGAMTKLVSKLVTWRGLTGRLARENTLRQPGRAAATAAALMIGLGLVTFASILAAGLTDTINQAIDRSFAGNLIVDNSSSAGNVGIPPGIPAALRTIPAVRDVTAVAFTEGKVRGVGSTESVTAIDPSDFASVYRLDWDAGSDAVLTRLGSTGTVLAKAFADSHKFRVGSHLRVLTPSGQRIELVVRGIVTDNAKLLGDLTITLALARGPFAQATDGVDFVSYAAGTRNSAVQPLVNRLLAARFPQTQSQTPAEFKSSEAGSVNSLLALISVLLALSIIVSLFGIVNTLVLSIFERTRELGMLRAIGATRWQIREMICEESIVIALIGGAFGVVLGVVASLIVAATALSGTGFVYAIPVPTLIILFVLAGVAGLIAALWPAGRAGRVNILEALATE